MSHQSLEDLGNVSGSPANGKILKYNSGAWGPADESGGGSSGAEYFEFYQWGDSLDRGGLLLDTGGTSTYIVHNSIPSANLFKKADAPTGLIFHADTFGDGTYNDVYWFAKDATDQYFVEVTLVVHYDSTTTVCPLLEWGYIQSNHGTPSVSRIARFPNHAAGSAVTYSGTEATLFRTGKVETIKGKYIISASLGSHSYMAMSPAIKNGRSNAGYVYFPCGSHVADTSSSLAIVRKHVKITKIA